jgi:RNA:NAD 2'-phosphotransferase (TPT1/KptA family)
MHKTEKKAGTKFKITLPRQSVFYHGTIKSNLPSILKSGLKATEGWGGAVKPGVFMSPTISDAVYWAKMAMLKKIGLSPDKENFNKVSDGDIAIIKIQVPPDRMADVIERKKKEFSLPNDKQFVGSIPKEWLSVI